MAFRPKRIVVVGAVAATLAATIAGCSSAPETTATATSAAHSDYVPCVLGDTGGFTDHSFNQLSLEGVQAAATQIGAEYKKYQSKSSDDYATGLSTLVSEGCNLIVAAGYQFATPMSDSAKANPDTDFAIIDDNSIDATNVKDIVFETDEAAFLGGYIAASYSKTGVVATWGGAEYPSVTIYMDGFADGVAYYNKQKSKNVKVLGWDIATQKGTFVGNFTDQNSAKSITQNFLDQDADVIVPIAGSLYEGAIAAIKASGSDAVIEGVDADIYQTDPDNGKYVLVSILKKVDEASKQVVLDASSATTFDNSQYVGTLKNGGVGISDLHDFTDKVDSGLAGELTTIQSGIEDGSITVESPSKLTK